MIIDMHKKMSKDLTAKSVVRNKVMKDYRRKVENHETCKNVIDILSDDRPVDSEIPRVREKL